MRARWTFVLVTILQAPAVAAAGAKPVNASPWMRAAGTAVRGERVIVVDTPLDRNARPAAPAGDTLADRLTSLGASCRALDAPYVPFRVGNSWVLAPRLREELQVDFPGLTADSIMTRGAALDRFVASLPRAQVSALASPDGLPVSSLARDPLRLLRHAIRPEAEIVSLDEASEEGKAHSVRTLSEPLDLSGASIAGCIEINGISLSADDSYVFIRNSPPPGTLLLRPAPANPRDPPGLDLRAVTVVNNTLKPSDLEGKRMTQPYGASGVVAMPDLLKRISVRTGLDLRCDAAYRETAVLVGSPEVSCGEIIDGLRLALAAAWRRLGPITILTWDRDGLGALQRRLRECTMEVARQAKEASRKSANSTVWQTLLRDLRPTAADPLALTPQQRARAVAYNQNGGEEDIGYPDMSAPQQEWLKRQFAEGRVLATAPASEQSPGPLPKIALDSSLAENAVLELSATLVLYLRVPGLGSVRLPRSLDYGSLGRGRGDESEDIVKEAPEDLRKAFEPKQIEFRAGSGCLMAPVLGEGQLTAIVRSMPRHGLSTLFYPILFDGYTTFPGTVFPVHPALRGADGWAKASRACAEAGIKIAPYVDVLSWRGPNDRVHWLSRRREWVDVDVLGRTRLEWAKGASARPGLTGASASGSSDYVDPGVPAVLARLTALLRDFAVRTRPNSIAFADWTPENMSMVDALCQWFGYEEAPMLGFTSRARLSAFLRYGRDPVDEPDDQRDFMPATLPEPYEQESARDSVENAPGAGALIQLVSQSSRLWPGIKVYVLEPEGGFLDSASVGISRTAISVQSLIANGEAAWITAPLLRREGIASLLDLLEVEADPGSAQIAMMRLNARYAPEPRDGIIIDARRAPEDILPLLGWLSITPPAKPAGAAPARTPASR